MIPNTYIVEYVGIRIKYSLYFHETSKFLGLGVSDNNKDGNEVHVSPFDIANWEKMGNTFNAFGEYSLLPIETSTKLLDYQRCIIHAVAVRWHDMAWLLTALPGIGKSTQYKNLKELYPEEVSIINGDKPILQLQEDGSIIVHPSPWNGKEGWKGADAAPLAGIICLKQAKENTIRKLTTQEAAVNVMAAIFHNYESAHVVHKAAKMATAILKHTPVWFLVNNGDLDSSSLLYETIARWEKETWRRGIS